MNKLFSVALITIALASLLGVSARQSDQTEPQEPGLITVTGDAEVRVAPDEVLITMGVETWNEDLDIAKAENDARVARVLARLQEHGVEAKHIQTDHVSIEPRYHDGYEKRGFIGFFVRKTIAVTLRDLDAFEDLLSDALASGVTHVHGIQFRTTSLREHKDQARALAVNAAREKAEAMAKELGQTVGAPRTVHEEQVGWWSWYGGWWGSYWSGSMAQNVVQNVSGNGPTTDSTLAPGQIAVNARVSVTFELK